MITVLLAREREDSFALWFEDTHDYLSLDDVRQSVPDPKVLESVLSLSVGASMFVTLGIIAIDKD